MALYCVRSFGDRPTFYVEKETASLAAYVASHILGVIVIDLKETKDSLGAPYVSARLGDGTTVEIFDAKYCNVNWREQQA